MYYFIITILSPNQDNELFDQKRLSKDQLKKVTAYLEQKTSQGVPVKFRVGIYDQTTDGKVMSVTLDSKKNSIVDVEQLLINRVSNPEVLGLLLEGHKKPKQQSEEGPEGSTITKPNEKKPQLSKEKNTRGATSKSKRGFYLGLATIVVLALAIVFQQVQLQDLKKEYTALGSQLENIEQAQTVDTQLDTFGRFFLTYYFSIQEAPKKYQDQLDPYLSVDHTSWSSLGYTLKSVHSFGLTQGKEKDDYQLTYLVILESEATSSELKQISFSVHYQDDQMKISDKPRLTDFSF